MTRMAISEALVFQSQGHFSPAFLGYTGVAPSAYRQREWSKIEGETS